MTPYERLRAAIAGERLPLALVDMDAFDRNVDQLCRVAREAGKPLRIATKSIRSPALIRAVLERGADVCRGLMCFSVTEAAELARRGHDDLLVAYPTIQRGDAAALAELASSGVHCALVVDDAEQLETLADAATARATTLPLVIELDMSLHWRRAHVGVHRSPIRDARALADLAAQIEARAGLCFLGVMAYEAQVAGVGDSNPFAPWLNPIKRAIKRASAPTIRSRRRAVVAELRRRGLEPTLFNGGGTGSLREAADDDSLTEVTAGSGFLCSHLFDYYRDFVLEPAAYFALQVVRRPAPDIVTCHGGGYVASGEAGRDKLPRPSLPEGLELTRLEGAGEVQTPLRCAHGTRVALGDPIFFRHAKAGELAEHFGELLLIRGDEIVGRAQTYRGAGLRFP